VKLGDLVANRFELASFVGEGGMGEIYRASDRQTGDWVALKRVLPDEAGERRFFREARALALLNHPAVVRYVAHGPLEGGEHYIAMEWVEGPTLRQRLDQSPLPLEGSLALVRRVASALGHAHGLGIVHGDLSPSNLLLSGGFPEQVKLVDFGLARHRADRAEPTLDGVGPMGTMGYLAPEQARGLGKVDARSDLFALGAILFECISGKAAFSADSYLGVLAKIVMAGAPRLRSTSPDVPLALDELVARLLAKEPADRPASAESVLEQLSQVGGSRPSLAAPLAGESIAVTEQERELVSVLFARRAHGDGKPPDVALSEHARALARARSLSFDALAQGPFFLTSAGSGVASDQAARVAHAALELRELDANLCIGVATGWATVVGGLPEGDVVERAARLAEASGSIAIDDVTRGLLPAKFGVSGERGHFSLLRLSESTHPARLLLGRATPCVGRERELRTLNAMLDECVESRLAQVALVTGPAGVGKSRVRYELVRELERKRPDLAIWIGRGDPMKAGAPLGAFRDALRHGLGLPETAPRELQENAIRARVADSVAPEARDRVAEFLGELLDVPFPESPRLAAARLDPVLMGDQMQRAAEDFLTAECDARPLLLILEDFQWGDSASANLLDRALRNLSERPFALLAIARPDIHDAFPGLWQARNVQEVRIGALTRRAAESLIRATLTDADEAGVSELVQRAAGNAFYLEELIRARAEGRNEALPDSVLGMVKERIENMEPEARRVLRAASVFGQSFWPGGVSALLGGDAVAQEISEWLTTLEQREVVSRRGASRLGAEPEYAFRHSLVRDAAYAMLPEHDRARGHRLAAGYLEQVGMTDGTLLAEHLERAGAPAEAARHWRVAARRALDAGDFVTAAARAERGLGASLASGESAELGLVYAEALRLGGRGAEALPILNQALAALGHGSAAFLHALGEKSVLLQRLGLKHELVELARELDLERAEEGADDALHLARARVALALLRVGARERARALVRDAGGRSTLLGPITAAHLHAFHAVEALLDGEPGRYLKEARRALRRHEEVGDERLALEQRINIGSVLMELGAHGEAESVLGDALSTAERLGLPHAVAGARHNLGLVLAHRGQFSQALHLEQSALGSFRQHDRRLEGGAELALAMILHLSGELERADEAARRAIDTLNEAAPPLVPAALGTLSKIRLAKGDGASALELARSACEALERGGVEYGEHTIRRAMVEALEAAGEAARARTLLATALERLRAACDKLDEPELRRAFLQGAPDNARLVELGQRWGVAAP